MSLIEKSPTDFSAIWDKVSNLPWCALVATGRTGSDAFQSQLDGHPEIIIFNGYLFFHDWWEQSTVAQHPGGIDLPDLVDECMWANIEMFKSRYEWRDRKGELGPNQDQEVPLDLEAFRSHTINLLQGREINSRNFLIAIYTAYTLALGQDINAKKVFIHHVHRVRKLLPYLTDFPDSKIIAMTRDPRAAYFSGVTHWRAAEKITDNPSFPLQILSRIVDEIEPIAKLNNEIRMMRLEDLNKPDVLKSVCQWLGTDFHSCVMSSTWAGLRWWGDRLSLAKTSKSMSEEEFVKTIRTNNWEQKLSSPDRYVLRVILDSQLRHYGYVPNKPLGFMSYLLVFPVIFLITGFEARYLNVKYLWATIRQRRLKDFLRTFYHYAKRVQYFLRLYRRSWHGDYHGVAHFPPSADKRLDK